MVGICMGEFKLLVFYWNESFYRFYNIKEGEMIIYIRMKYIVKSDSGLYGWDYLIFLRNVWEFFLWRLKVGE